MTATLTDGTYTEITPDSGSEIMAALTAAAAGGTLHPPREWFQNPMLDRPTPIAVTADGRIYGHIAPWDVEHTGMPGVRPPRSPSNYAFFRTGVTVTKEGDEVPVGQITLAGGHCNDLTASAGAAVKHYDDTASAVADVNIGEDVHGIWVAGMVRPNTTEEQIHALRASAPSGDWRPINGNRELVAICQVNTPGFPVARAMVASGEMVAIVGAGASAMYSLRQQDTVLATAVQDMDGRLTRLEDAMVSRNESSSVTHTSTSGNSPIVFNVTAGMPDQAVVAAKFEEGSDTGPTARRLIEELSNRGWTHEEIGKRVDRAGSVIGQISRGEIRNPPESLIAKLRAL